MIRHIWFFTIVLTLLTMQSVARTAPQPEDIQLHGYDASSVIGRPATMVEFGGYSTPKCRLALSDDGKLFYLTMVHSTCRKLTNSKSIRIICNSNKSVCKTRSELSEFVRNGAQSTYTQSEARTETQSAPVRSEPSSMNIALKYCENDPVSNRRVCMIKVNGKSDGFFSYGDNIGSSIGLHTQGQSIGTQIEGYFTKGIYQLHTPNCGTAHLGYGATISDAADKFLKCSYYGHY